MNNSDSSYYEIIEQLGQPGTKKHLSATIMRKLGDNFDDGKLSEGPKGV